MKKLLIIAIMLCTAAILTGCSSASKATEGVSKAEGGTAPEQTSAQTEKQTEKQTEQQSPPETEKKDDKYVPPRMVRIACVGDSITYGVGASNPSMGSYPSQLKLLLGNKYAVMNYGKSSSYMINPKDYPDFKFASTRSVAYTSTTEYQNSLTSSPDIVVICLGANDAYISNTNSGVDQERYFYDSAVALAKKYQSLASKPTVYFMYPPARYDAQYRIDYIKSTIIPKIDAAAKECGCEVIDLFSLTEKYAKAKDLRYFTNDGIHLANEGYKLMASAVYEKVSEYRVSE